MIGSSGPVAGARVLLHPEALVTDVQGRFEHTAQRSAATDPHGRLLLRGVAAGELALWPHPRNASGGEYRWHRLSLRAGEEHALELEVDAPPRAH